MSSQDEKIKELEEQLETLQTKSQLKDQFFASIAHELRTPMNAVIGLSQILLTGNLDRKQKEYINKIESSGNILVELVNDILDFSKIEAGKLSVEHIMFDINDVLDNVAQILAIKAQEKGIELVFNLEDKFSNVFKGDPLRLGQIIINLMGNAIKFTEKGEVSLHVKPLDKETLQFRVHDTGIGLKQEQIDRLFQNFVQASASTSRKYGGSGLGLMISKQLVNLMGGDIHVESEYGKGSEFIFTIKTTFEEDKRLYHLPSKDLVGKSVLLIDKNSTTLNALSNMLHYFKYESIMLSDIEEAEKMIESKAFDIIFIDMKMIKLLKDDIKIKGSDTKIVVLNSGIEISDQKSLNGIHIDGFLLKPFNLHKVFEMILEVYERDIISLSAKENQLSKRDLVRLKGSHIAIAEDNKINQTVIKAMLEDTEIEVNLFDNGQELLEYLDRHSEKIDLILMDANMPIMDGYEATIAIRKENRYDSIPIIALTASQAQSDIDRALEVGMAEYLSKPIYMHQLYSTLIKYIKPKVEKNVPKVEDLILFSAKYNASIRKFKEHLEKGRSEEMEKLIIKMEREANSVDIDMLNGMTVMLQDILKTRQEALNNFVYEYEEASDTFLKACAAFKEDFAEVSEEDKRYAFQVLSLEEGIEALGEENYRRVLLEFCEQFQDSLKLIQESIHDRPKLQNFAEQLHHKAQELKAKIMIGLSLSLNTILEKESEGLGQFIEQYQHSFESSNYQNY